MAAARPCAPLGGLPAPKTLGAYHKKGKICLANSIASRGIYFARLFCGGIFLAALYNIFGFFNIYIKQILDITDAVSLLRN